MPRKRSRVPAMGALALVTVIAGLILVPDAAQAADRPTTIAFASPTQTVAYGSDWMASLTITTPYQAVDENDGTVDVFVDGDTRAFATGVHIYPGGDVFVTQPVADPPLAAGTHALLAIFRPAAGSGLATSQTATPLNLTISPLALSASARVVGSGRSPVVHAALSGAYVDALGTPAGEWTVTVTAGTRTIVRHVARGSGMPASTDIPVGTLPPGKTASVVTRFAVATGSASGPVEQPGPLRYAVPGETPSEILSTPVATPWWAIAVSALVVLGGLASLIVQIVRLARRRTPDRGPADASQESPQAEEELV